MNRTKVLIAICMGNILETYELTLYPLLAIFLLKIFMPIGNIDKNFLFIFLIFCASYLARPAGALVIGYVGDTYGRKKALLLSISLMLISGILIAILPTYKTIGYYSTFMLLLLRMIQGFSYGGEYTGSVIYLTETSPINKKNSYAMVATMSSNFGILCANVICLLLTICFNEQQILDWAWRIGFIVPILFGLVCLILRNSLHEYKPNDIVKLKQQKQTVSFIQILKHQKMSFMLLIILTWFGVVTTYLLFIYFVPHLINYLHYKPINALMISAISITVLVFTIPYAGIMADKYNRKNIIIVSIISLAIMIIPYFYILSNNPQLPLILLIQIIIAIPSAFYFAIVPVLITDMIQEDFRYRGVSVAYNTTTVLFGGTTPIVVIHVIKLTNLSCAPGLYLIFCAICTLISIILGRRYIIS